MPQDFTDDKSILVQIMAWCCQASSHYQSWYWPILYCHMVSPGTNELGSVVSHNGKLTIIQKGKKKSSSKTMQFMCWLLSLLLRAALVSREPPYGTSSYNKHFITTSNIVHSYLLTLWNCVFSLLDLPIKTLLCMFGGVLAWNYDSTLILQCLSMVFNEICINILTWKHWQIKITSFDSNIA